MGGRYERGLYRQLEETINRLDALEEENKGARKEIKRLTGEVQRLNKENEKLRVKLAGCQEELKNLRSENKELRRENQLLKDDNERMKRILNNDSSNSSLPPSTDQRGKAANTYNSREKSGRKAGGQKGHKGYHLTKAEVERKIREGVYEYRLEEIGVRGRAYVSRYRLDLEIKTVATEIRIYADEKGKYAIPNEMKAEVFYGKTVRAISAFLYSEGVVANDRICSFLNSLSGDSLHISTGSIYEFCRKFENACERVVPQIEEEILNAPVICTDATTISVNGVQTYIRNFSTEYTVVYHGADKKNLETLESFQILREYTGIVVHDHETALYHFGTAHAECNVHLNRYLMKNTEESGNLWSHHMRCFLNGLNEARKKRICEGKTAYTEEEILRYETRYDTILACGLEENQKTQGRIAKQEEKALLNRLTTYKKNHLLFLHDFRVPFSNNRSEKDLRICKNRQKMAGGFRNQAGRKMYCNILSVIETAKRRGLNIFHSITALMNGANNIFLTG